MATPSPTPPSWWGETPFSPDETRRWKLGSLTLWARRLEREWRLTSRTDPDPLAAELEVAATVPEDDPPADLVPSRYAFDRSGDRLTLTPALADRPVIVRPDGSFAIAPGEEVTLYVSTPVWLRIEAGSPARRLTELPSFRPSDTWFGPSTRVGELAYATRTSARLNLAELPTRPHRAITPVRIRNRAGDALAFQRLRVPVPLLALHAAPDAALWTQAVTLTHEQEGDLAAVQIERGAPREASGGRQLVPPRQTAETGLTLRVFGRLFGSSD